MPPVTPLAPWSLRYELTRVLVLASLLPAMVFGTALLWNQWHRDESDLLVRLASNAQLAASAIDDFLQGQLSGVVLAADGLAAQGVGADGIEIGVTTEESLARLLHAYPAMRLAVVADGEGNVAKVQTAPGVPVGDGGALSAYGHPLPAPGERSEPRISDGYRSLAAGNEALVAVSAPLLRDGRLAGTLQVAIPVNRFSQPRSDSLSLRGFELLVLDKDDHVIHAGRGLRWQFGHATGRVGAKIRQGASLLGRSGEARVLADVLRDDGDAFVHAVALPSGWVVAVVAAEQRLMAPSLPRMGLMLGLLLVTLLGALLSLWRMRRLLNENMGLLVTSLHGYALGGAMDPARLGRLPDELKPLAKGIGDLAARMNAAFGELQQVLDQREQAIAERTASLHQAVGELDRLSRTDALTGSLNYRGFQEAAERLWREARNAGVDLSVLALDIDYFKRYNDHYGHSEGDGALRRFAGAVRSALLHTDDVLARPGGEEFFVFLPGSTFQQAMQVGERVCQRVRDADIMHAGSPQGRMTVSVGVAIMATDDTEAEDMLRRADAAMYRAKHAGRNRVSD